MNENLQDTWFIKYWRPGMAWLYMAICAFDFIIMPVLFYSLQDFHAQIVRYIPITMHGGGLFHVAMGAIIGVTAWSRGQEKMKYMEYYGISNPVEQNDTSTSTTTTEKPPQ